MLKKINDFLSSLKMTIIAGLFLILDLVPHITGEEHLKIFPFDPAWIAVIISGIPMLYLALWRVKYNKGISKISSALLISIAMIAAILIGDLFAAGEVAFIMALGALLEDATTNRAKKGLKNLINLKPATGRIIKSDGCEEIVKTESIHKDDILRILPGETIPVDGVIISGETSIDQAVMTGESLPQDKTIGDDVFSGTINRFGSIDIKATKVGKDSSLERLIKLVEDAEKKQAPMQRIADKAASYLVPVALMIAILSYVFTRNIVTAVTVLVVFCPCALVLATPTAIMAAIGQATKHGVIIKSGEALEKMGKVDTICFDKTGTLTYGKLEVSDIIPINENLEEEKLLALCASAESKSEHPVAKAIVECARNKGLKILTPDSFKMTSGRGIEAEIEKKAIIAGNEKFLSEKGIKIEADLEKFKAEGKALVLVAENNIMLGLIALSDTLRPDAKSMIANLKGIGVKPVLLTGDNKRAASYFAKKVEIDDVRSDLLPEDKVKNIESLKEEGRKVAMIGDGVNDAPALKTANVSIAMAKMGSDIAIDAAEIALIGDDISKLPYLKRLSNATVKTIKFSISLSMCINFIAIVLSLMEVLTPTTGALVHNAGSCFVVLIAALLYDRKFE